MSSVGVLATFRPLPRRRLLVGFVGIRAYHTLAEQQTPKGGPLFEPLPPGWQLTTFVTIVDEGLSQVSA